MASRPDEVVVVVVGLVDRVDVVHAPKPPSSPPPPLAICLAEYLLNACEICEKTSEPRALMVGCLSRNLSGWTIRERSCCCCWCCWCWFVDFKITSKFSKLMFSFDLGLR